MEYPLSKKYDQYLPKIMGPNPVKLEEELLRGHQIPEGAVVCDLGSGQGLTSIFLAKEYGFTVYAADLWSDPQENRAFFREMGLTDEQIVPVKDGSIEVSLMYSGTVPAARCVSSISAHMGHISISPAASKSRAP